jgi:hypothetical protein
MLLQLVIALAAGLAAVLVWHRRRVFVPGVPTVLGSLPFIG